MTHSWGSDDLSGPSSDRSTRSNPAIVESTNLSHRESGPENLLGVVVGGPQSNEQKCVRGEKGTRLDKHGDDGFVQSTGSTLPHYGANVPGVQDEPDDDHEGEKDVE